MPASLADQSGSIPAADRALFPSIVVFTVAFLVRAAFVLVQYKVSLFRGSFYTADSQVYDTLAQSLVSGLGFVMNGTATAVYPPVYPAFLASCYWLFGRNFLRIGIIQSALSAVSCVFTFKIAHAVFGQRVAWIAGSISALMPDLIFWTSGSITTEALYVMLMMGALYFLIRLLSIGDRGRQTVNRNLSSALLAGLGLGLASLTRPVAFYFGLCALLFLLLYAGLFRAAVVGSVFLLLLVPWGYRNQRMMGAAIITSTGGGVPLYHYHNPLTTGENGGYSAAFYPLADAERLPEIERDGLYRSEAITYAFQHPRREIWLTLNRFWNMWRPAIARAPWPYHGIAALTYIPMMLFALPVIAMRGFRSPQLGMLTLFLGYHFIFHLLTVAELRYRIPLEPVISVYAAASVNYCFSRRQKTERLLRSSTAQYR